MTDIEAGRQPDADLRRELLYLGRERLLFFIIISGTLGWAWFPYVMFRGWPLSQNLTPSLALVVTTGAALYFYIKSDRYYYLCCSAVLLGMVAAFASTVAAHYASSVMAFGVLIVIAAISLLGARPAIIAPILVWIVGTAAQPLGAMRLDSHGVEILFLYVLSFLFVSLSSRSLTIAAEWAMNGWAKASQALTEARQRRAELRRAVRALEEASYRIERMNRELIMAHHQAEAERDSKARFAAIVSHELRGPLSLILGFSKMMVLSPERYAAALPPSYRSDIVTIYENSQHLASLVDDVLDLSRIDADRLSLVKAQVDIGADVIARCVSSVRPWARRKGLHLRTQIAQGLPCVMGDSIRLRQVLLNLLTNAIRFTETGGVTVTATASNGRVLVSVRDTGPGIPADELTRVFDEFRQASRPSGGDLGGTGLGLSISKQLVRLHEGDIWVTSTEGMGSEFTFALPVAASASPTNQLVASAPFLRGGKIPDVCIIVNGDPDVVRRLARQLGDYRIVGTPDPEQLPSLVEQLHPAGIITGMDMATQVCRALAVQHAHVPVLTCSIMHQRADYGAARVLGHLVKPFTAEMLNALMRQAEYDGETTVLLVDDDPDAVRLLEGMLMVLPRPYRILRAYSGSEALRVMQDVVPDVALIDLVMRDMRGDELIRRMAECARTRRVSIIIVSANDVVSEGIKLAPPISVHCSQVISVDKGARFMRAAFEVFQPDYLLESGPEPLADPVG